MKGLKLKKIDLCHKIISVFSTLHMILGWILGPGPLERPPKSPPPPETLKHRCVTVTLQKQWNSFREQRFGDSGNPIVMSTKSQA